LSPNPLRVDEIRKIVHVPNTDVTIRSIVQAAQLSYTQGRRYYDIVCGEVRIGHVSILKPRKVETK
jgi:hypothetical protein